jgi:hypothetical protein
MNALFDAANTSGTVKRHLDEQGSLRRIIFRQPAAAKPQ